MFAWVALMNALWNTYVLGTGLEFRILGREVGRMSGVGEMSKPFLDGLRQWVRR